MKFQPKLIIYLISVVLFFSTVDIAIAIEKKNNLVDFLEIISKNGWKGSLYELKYPVDPGITLSIVGLDYEFPDDIGYYQSLQVFQLTFNELNDIPSYDGSVEQIYPRGYGSNAFPIQNYKGILYEPVHFKMYWNAYRNRNRVYIVFSGVSRQDIDSMFQLLIKFIKLNGESDNAALAQLEETIKKTYIQNKEFYEGVQIVQDVLISQGFYRNSVDGVFGMGTKKAFQLFLKDKGHYKGEVDGRWGKGSINALKIYQKDLNIHISDKINLETAEAIKKSELK